MLLLRILPRLALTAPALLLWNAMSATPALNQGRPLPTHQKQAQTLGGDPIPPCYMVFGYHPLTINPRGVRYRPGSAPTVGLPPNGLGLTDADGRPLPSTPVEAPQYTFTTGAPSSGSL